MHDLRTLNFLERNLSYGAMNIGGWIHDPAIFVDFEVDVGSRGSAGGAHQGDVLTFLDDIADIYQQFFGMGVTGGVTIAMINLNHEPIIRPRARPGYHAGCDGIDIRTRTTGAEIQSGVKCEATGKGIGALTKSGNQPTPRHWPSSYEYIGPYLAVHHKPFEDLQLLLAIFQLSL